MATLNVEKVKERKKKRIKWYILFTIVEMLTATEVVYVIHQILKYKTMSGIDYRYINAFGELLTVYQMQVLFCLTQILWILFLISISNAAEAVISEVDTIEVTDAISIPVTAGNGQYGNERFLTEEEKEEIFDTFVFTGKEKELQTSKGGIVVQMIKDGMKETILYVSKDFHTLIFGASGGGKTRRILLETIWLQLLSGICAVVNDVKGELYYYTAPFARTLGYAALAIDFRNPKKSVHYNFMDPILQALDEKDRAKAIDYVWDLVSVLVGQQKGEPIWYNGECASIAAGILIVALDAPREYANLTNVYYFLAYMCKADQFGEMPLDRYMETLSDTHPAKGVFAQAEIAAHKTRSSFFTSALGTLRLFTNPNIAEMTSRSDFDLKDIGQKKIMLYMIIPDEKKTYYPLVSLLITQLYALQVEVANQNGLRLPIDTDYDIDEAGALPYIPVLATGTAAGRSRGIRFHLIIQDYQQLESKYKEEFKTIMTNCQIKLYLKSDDPGTLKMVSENLGKYTVEVASASTSVSEGQGSYSAKNNMNFSSSASLAGRALLEPAEVKRIEAPYSICMMTGKYAAINILPDLSEYKLNSILGLGDEKWNNQLIMKREAEREEHFVPEEPKLWGIWNSFKAVSEEEPTERISFIN